MPKKLCKAINTKGKKCDLFFADQHRGFIPLLLLVVFAVVAVGGGVYYVEQNKAEPVVEKIHNVLPPPPPVIDTTQNSPEPIQDSIVLPPPKIVPNVTSNTPKVIPLISPPPAQPLQPAPVPKVSENLDVLTLTYPIGDHQWRNASEHTVTWKGPSGGTVNIVLQANRVSYPVAVDSANDGSESIVVPLDIDVGVYQLRIYCVAPCRGPSPLDPPQNSITVGMASPAISSILPPSSIISTKNYTPSAGKQNVKVFLFNFPDLKEEPFDVGVSDTIFFAGNHSLKEYIKEVSYGKYVVNGKSYGWFTLPQNREKYCTDKNGGWFVNCYSQQLISDAAAIAKAQVGVEYDEYPFFVFHGAGGAAVTGFADNGKNIAGVHLNSEVINNGFLRTIVHEFGHLLKAGHAGGWYCGNGIVGADLSNLTVGCTVHSRSDGRDPMGSQLGHFSAYHKEVMGFLEPTQTTIANTSGEFLLDQLEMQSGGVKQIKIPLGENKFYSLEYRKPTGFDGAIGGAVAAVDGVMLRLALSSPIDDGVDTLRPQEPLPLVVNPGLPFVDTFRNIRVEVTEKLANQVKIRITK